jgi:hypothetical protein
MPELRDPFTLVYSKLWQMLEASTDFCALVSAGNRIKYIDDLDTDGSVDIAALRNPDKGNLQAGDFPQVAIESDDGITTLARSSDATSVSTRFRVMVLAGDKRLSYLGPAGRYTGLFPVMWSIVRALSTWDTQLTTLNWGTETGFVKLCNLTTHRERLGKALDEKRDVYARKDGWTMAWEGEVEMWFSTASLAPT